MEVFIYIAAGLEVVVLIALLMWRHKHITPLRKEAARLDAEICKNWQEIRQLEAEIKETENKIKGHVNTRP